MSHVEGYVFARADRAVVLDLRMRHEVGHVWHVTGGGGQKRHRRHRWHRRGSGYGTGGTHQRRSPIDWNRQENHDDLKIGFGTGMWKGKVVY